MNISSVTSSLVTANVDGVSSKRAQSTQAIPPPPPPGDSAGMSKMAETMKSLSELQSSDPDKFKDVTASIAKSLEELAKDQSGEDASRLTELAEKFKQASESGTMDSLQPPPPPSGGQMPSAASAYERTQSQVTGTDFGEQIQQIISDALANV
jgi:hypothetical protein